MPTFGHALHLHSGTTPILTNKRKHAAGVYRSKTGWKSWRTYGTVFFSLSESCNATGDFSAYQNLFLNNDVELFCRCCLLMNNCEKFTPHFTFSKKKDWYKIHLLAIVYMRGRFLSTNSTWSKSISEKINLAIFFWTASTMDFEW